jgi:hypothetical protein
VQSEATKRKVTEAWNRRTPAPEGAVVAWRWQEYDHPEDPWLYSETGPREHEEHANRQPLYASPVIPVGGREAVARATCQDCGGHSKANLCQPCEIARIIYATLHHKMAVNGTEAQSLYEQAARSILAALRPTDTGWRDIATANRGQKVIIHDPRWGVTEGLMMDDGTWGLATFNGQIMKASPTHWMPLPPAPTDTGANHD